MLAHRAQLRRVLADHQVAAVAALPDAVAVAAEHDAFLDVFQQLQVARLVRFFNGGDAVKQLAIWSKPSALASSPMVLYISVHS